MRILGKRQKALRSFMNEQGYGGAVGILERGRVNDGTL